MTVAVLAALLAGDAPPTLSTWLPTIIVALIAVSGVVFGAWVTLRVKRLNAPVDNATVLKTHVEAEKLRAETERMRIDSDGREVEIARGLLDDIRKELDRYRAEMDRVRLDSERRIAEVVESTSKQHAEVTGQLDAVRAEQARQRLRLEQHVPWDLAATALLRRSNPDFPDPPPVNFG